MNDERLDHLIRFYSFCTLTQNVKAERKVFHSAGQGPQRLGCILVKFGTSTRMNWQYECANAFLQTLNCTVGQKQSRRGPNWDTS